MSDAEILDASAPPEGWAARLAASRCLVPEYLAVLARSGPRALIENAGGRAGIVRVGDRAMPLIELTPGDARTDVCSAYVHYVDYSREEWRARAAGPATWIAPAGIGVLDVVLRACRIDRLLYVNNWLFSTNPPPGLSTDDIVALVELLVELHPDAAIVFRSICPTFDPASAAALGRAGFRLVRSREVYLLDTRRSGFLARHNVRADFALLADSPYEILETIPRSGRLASRINRLYRMLYLERHSRLNAAYTDGFFAALLGARAFRFHFLRRDGRVDAFVMSYVAGGSMIGLLVGYDTRLPRELGLYRICVASLIRDAWRDGLRLHLSAGAGRFKMLRGCRPASEFDAVYDRHLPRRRRLPWRLLELGGAIAERTDLATTAERTI